MDEHGFLQKEAEDAVLDDVDFIGIEALNKNNKLGGSVSA